MSRRARGFSLPELMVSLTLGLLLLAAFVAVLTHCRREFAASESMASLQDSARQALSVLVPDLEHAGFFGFAHDAIPQYVRGGVALAAGDELRQPDETPTAPVPGLPAGAHDCGVNFAVDLLAVEGSNHCEPSPAAGGMHAGSDMLTVRHASLETAAPHAGRLQIYSQRIDERAAIMLFADGRAPGATNEDAEIRDLEVRTYYVANDSVGRRGWPALRVRALTEARGAAQFRDEEVLPGVEDLQVEIGVRDPADPEKKLSFVAPDLTGLRQRHLVAVRLWLRIRADRTEPGFVDTRPLAYAGVEFIPDAFEAKQRRVLLTRTVALRNASLP